MNEEKELPTLLQLNDDCLYSIFNRLSIKEQLQLANTCKRFRFIITQMIWRTQFQETRTIGADTDELNNQEYQQLFHHIVEYIEKFTIADNKHLVFSSYLGRYAHRPELAFYLCSYFPRLIFFECLDHRLHDGLLRLIVENCPKLQVLKVSSDYITGAHIKDMRNLRELYLPRCSLSAEHLQDIFQHLNLTHLDIAGSKLHALPYNEHSFSKLRYLKLAGNQIEADFVDKCNYLYNLECLTVANLEQEATLHVPWQDLYEKLGPRVATMKIYNAQDTNAMLEFMANTSKFSAIEKIFIKGHLDDRYLNNFAQLAALKEFQLYTYEPIRPAAILNFISRCKYLQRLDLICCDNLFGMHLHWLLDIIEILRKQNGRSRLCLNLVHSDLQFYEQHISKVKRQVMEDLRYASQTLLQITFNMPPIEYTPTFDQYFEMHLKKKFEQYMKHYLIYLKV